MDEKSGAYVQQPEKAVTSGETASLKDHVRGRQFSLTGENEEIVAEDTNKLKRNLHGRHMQMIAIGRHTFTRSCRIGVAYSWPRWCDWRWVVCGVWQGSSHRWSWSSRYLLHYHWYNVAHGYASFG